MKHILDLPKTRKLAKESNSIWYFTEKPCKYGHIVKRYTRDGKCSKCSCINACKNWNKKHPKIDKSCPICQTIFLSIKNKIYCSRNCLSKSRYIIGSKRTKTILDGIKYRQDNKEIAKEYRKRNYEKLKIANTRKEQKRRAIKRAATIEEEGLQEHLINLQTNPQTCYLCGHQIEKKDLNLDHVIPLIKGGKHAASNIQPTHFLCNMKKGKKLPQELGLVEIEINGQMKWINPRFLLL